VGKLAGFLSGSRQPASPQSVPSDAAKIVSIPERHFPLSIWVCVIFEIAIIL
jgi:hypothetical protein